MVCKSSVCGDAPVHCCWMMVKALVTMFTWQLPKALAHNTSMAIASQLALQNSLHQQGPRTPLRALLQSYMQTQSSTQNTHP